MKRLIRLDLHDESDSAQNACYCKGGIVITNVGDAMEIIKRHHAEFRIDIFDHESGERLSDSLNPNVPVPNAFLYELSCSA